MAQVAQKVLGRNTEKTSQRNRIRVRNWVFTLNNYTPEEIKELAQQECYLFQEETGENGTPHLQGILCFKNPMSLSSMKKVNGRCHWEPCRNKIASIQYCCKESTRTGKVFSNFDYLKYVVQVAQAQVPDQYNSYEFFINNRNNIINEMVNDTTCDDIIIGSGGVPRLR
nr:rep protein [Cressdnaviricota sp.]UOF82583.1 rep protein [Cressdnaviricota sp.]